MYEYWNNYYYLIIIAQIFCIVHAMKTGRKEWLYIVIFLPLAGAVAYFIREILPEINRGEFTANLQRLFMPGKNVRDLERRVRISDTVTNKLQLADAYAQQQEYGKAITLAESCLNAHHANDPGITLKLARLYFYSERYMESIACFNKLLSTRNFRFNTAEDELIYTRVLEGNRDTAKAEEEYKRIIRVHHSLEAMYYYGMMLKQQQRQQEAMAQFQAVRDEIDLHPRYVRRLNRQWVRLSKKEMASM